MFLSIQVAPVFPEFDIYAAEGHWPFDDFCQSILRNAARGSNKSNAGPKPRKSRKKKRNEAAQTVVQDPLHASLDDPDKSMEDLATYDNDTEPVQNDAQAEPAVTLAPINQEEATPDALVHDFSMLSFHPGNYFDPAYLVTCTNRSNI
jgi:hypothetical protein